MIRLLYTPEILERWSAIANLAVTGIDRSDGQLSLDEMLRSVMRGSVHVWWNDEPPAVLFTRIIDYPGKKTCRLILIVANMDLVERFLPTVEVWAREMGCNDVDLFGRKGWRKALPDYRETHVILSKRIDGIRKVA